MASGIAQTNQQVDDKILLGYLSFYNLGDLKITESELEQLFDKNKLDKKYIRKISPADAYRRSTSKAKESITINYNGQATKAYLEVNELKHDANGIVRLLGRKLVDEKNETLSYEVVGRMEFERSGNSISCSITPDTTIQAEYDYQRVLDDIVNTYMDWTVYHTKDTIRNLSNNIIKEFYPVNLLPSGLCKFIPKNSKDDLFALRGLIKDLSMYGSGNEFECIPVIDTDEQRQLVQKSFMGDVQEELKLFASELKDVLDKKATIPTRTAQTYALKYQDLKAKTDTYGNLVGVYMKTVHEQIQQALQYVSDNKEDEK